MPAVPSDSRSCAIREPSLESSLLSGRGPFDSAASAGIEDRLVLLVPADAVVLVLSVSQDLEDQPATASVRDPTGRDHQPVARHGTGCGFDRGHVSTSSMV